MSGDSCSEAEIAGWVDTRLHKAFFCADQSLQRCVVNFVDNWPFLTRSQCMGKFGGEKLQVTLGWHPAERLAMGSGYLGDHS